MLVSLFLTALHFLKRGRDLINIAQQRHHKLPRPVERHPLTETIRQTMPPCPLIDTKGHQKQKTVS
jgi:hypothetical protein